MSLQLLSFLLSFQLMAIVQLASASAFTATFFFGDSTLDTGNNNFIPTAFRGNHTPYGVNFPGKIPTGRFSDGRVVPDLLTSALNIKPFSPPYLDPGLSDDDVRTGVNFASGGAGYDDVTASVTSAVPVSRQLEMFGEYLERLRGVVGEEESRRIVEGALVVFSAGGNDMIFSFYDLALRTATYDLAGYQDFLHGNLKDAVKSVYNNGGRKFVIAGLPPIGCLPMQMTAGFKNPLNRNCVDGQISDTIAYNAKLRKLLPELQRSLPGSKIEYLDITDNIIEIINNPEKYGYKETKKGCCGTGFVEAGPVCNKYTPLCEDVSSFVFFDSIHPTERIYKIVTDEIMNNAIPKLY